MDLNQAKKLMRRELKKLIAACPAGERERWSRRIGEHLFSTDWWKEAGLVLAFMSMPDEVATEAILTQAHAQGRRLALPRVSGERIVFHLLPASQGGAGPRASPFRPGPFGIREPAADLPLLSREVLAETPCLVLVPGLAFDRAGRRLGRGKGYYDRFLAGVRKECPQVRAVALGFALQILEEVPAGPGDQLLDGIVTEAGATVCRHP